jgi:signal transduction histidine kinase
MAGENLRYEKYYTQSDKSIAWFNIKLQPVTDDEKNTVGICIAVSDITQKKNAEIDHNRMTKDLMQRNKDLEQFAYIVSHNLRAPVANIIGFANAMTQTDYLLSEEEKNEVIQGLNGSAYKLDNVIRDLNHILNVKQQVNLAKEVISFLQIVNDIKLSISNSIEKDNVQIIADFTSVDKMFSIKSYIYSIFFNLISNSIKYRRKDINPVINIKSYKESNKLKLCFSDNGLGIDLVKNAEQIFGLYKRFHRNTEGKGMGLFMVKTQVENLNGKISVKSEVNKGAEFIIEFEEK